MNDASVGRAKRNIINNKKDLTRPAVVGARWSVVGTRSSDLISIHSVCWQSIGRRGTPAAVGRVRPRPAHVAPAALTTQGTWRDPTRCYADLPVSYACLYNRDDVIITSPASDVTPLIANAIGSDRFHHSIGPWSWAAVTVTGNWTLTFCVTV